LNLPPIGEETLVLCMVLATMAGALVGFALGYGLKEKKHAREIESIIRITKRIETAKKERAPKDPAHYPSHRLPC
jgi:membrane protein YqaA with SNARE-associated domain